MYIQQGVLKVKHYSTMPAFTPTSLHMNWDELLPLYIWKLEYDAKHVVLLILVVCRQYINKAKFSELMNKDILLHDIWSCVNNILFITNQNAIIQKA